MENDQIKVVIRFSTSNADLTYNNVAKVTYESDPVYFPRPMDSEVLVDFIHSFVTRVANEQHLPLPDVVELEKTQVDIINFADIQEAGLNG